MTPPRRPRQRTADQITTQSYFAPGISFVNGTPTGNVGLARQIKPRNSRTAGTTYLSNGCQHCDALQGAFFIFHEELPAALADGGLDGLDHLADADMPAAEWEQMRDDAAAMWD